MYSTAFAFAQQRQNADTIKTYTLPEIVVTATRSEKSTADIARSVSVLTAEQFRSQLSLSAGEVLTAQPGMYVVGAGQNPGALQSVFLRGAGSNQTAVFIDDVRLTDPASVNNALDASELSFVGVERVEIVRGVHSTLYGSSALGGVVNLITRKQRAPGLSVDATLRAGVFGPFTSLFREDVALGYAHESGVYATLDAMNERVNGLDATVDTVTRADVFQNRDRDGFRKTDLYAKVGFHNDRLDLYAGWKRVDQRADFDKGAYRDDDNSIIDVDRTVLTYGAAYRWTDWLSFRLIGGRSTMSRIAVDDSSVVDRTGKTDQTYSESAWDGTTATNELQAQLTAAGVRAVIGGGWYRETMTARSYFYTNTRWGAFEFRTDLDSLNLKTTTSNLFAHLDLNGTALDASLARFALALGVRFGKHSSFGNHGTYEVNPSLRLGENGLVYAMYATGFNAPSLYQLFTPERNSVSDITRGNKHLQPERSRSVEIGFKQSIGKQLEFGVSYFDTRVENAIEYVFLWEKNIGIDTLGNDWMRNDFRGDTYLNLGRQHVSGFELTVSSQLTEQLRLSGAFSLLSGKQFYRPRDIDGAHTGGHHVQLFSNGAFVSREVETPGLVRRPNTAHVSLVYEPSPEWWLRLDVRHAGSRDDIYYDSRRGPYGALGTLPVAAYTLLDISNRVEVINNVILLARVENVLNERYQEINGFTTRGRGFYLGLRYRWGE
jgi:vitamin B12 transporter